MLIIKIGCKGTTNIAYTQIKVKLFSLKFKVLSLKGHDYLTKSNFES